MLPQALCSAFTHSREYVVLDNEYANGESQRSLVTGSSRKSWQLSEKLTATLLTALLAFYVARNGPLEAFYFYDPFDPGSVYDPTFAATTGRYVVHFVGTLTYVLGIPRAEASLSLTELA